ncbi:hypothetical protein NNRS527_00037 [Nitrosospira sp. NRS527]|nr:hypothetical protein NNRS527_00037 [Nitrosospira sp. NRS527]
MLVEVVQSTNWATAKRGQFAPLLATRQRRVSVKCR